MTSATAAAPVRILIVDDTPSIHEDFRKILIARETDASLDAAEEALFAEAPVAPAADSFSLDSALQGQEALALVERAVGEGRPYALAFVDMRMPPGWDGIETIRRLWQVDAMLQVVICTAYSDYSWSETIRQLGSTDNLIILKKPFDNIEVLQLAHALTRKWQLAQKLAARMWDLAAEVKSRTDELRAAEARFTSAFAASPLPSTLQQNGDLRFLSANPAFLELTGRTREEVVGHLPSELELWPEGEAWLESAARGERLRKQPARLRTRDGKVRDVLVSSESIAGEGDTCSLWLIDDVTDRLLLEQQLLQAQKMESVGHLAAGIAHDFNNLLTAIQIYSEEALRECDPGSRMHEDLQEVHAAGRRAAALTRQLLIFSRKQFSELAPLQVGEVIDRMLPMLRRLIGEDIELFSDWESPLPTIEGDENNIEQVVLNLIVNARDAMPDGGEIRLGLRRATLTAVDAGQHSRRRAGEFIQLTVADNGCGIPEEIQEKVFEPLFTTKGSGKGTGLGLSTVRTIVQQHNGWIELRSSRAGTSFDIFLPVAAASAAGAAGAGESLAAECPRGSGRILVAEDDEVVRNVLAVVLPRYGYHATITHDGVEALARWEQMDGAFDLLLTDIVMPKGVSGVELARELRRRKPDLRVILSTGYSAELLQQRTAVPVPDATVLLKPYRPDVLLSVLRKLLQGVPTR
jgi:two-component system cell cycle sensor histidine kinase/response regulator CckA